MDLDNVIPNRLRLHFLLKHVIHFVIYHIYEIQVNLSISSYFSCLSTCLKVEIIQFNSVLSRFMLELFSFYKILVLNMFLLFILTVFKFIIIAPSLRSSSIWFPCESYYPQIIQGCPSRRVQPE